MAPLNTRPIYANEQLEEYISLVFPDGHALRSLPKFREALSSNIIATLSALQLHHLATIPWGNVALHYSKERNISLDEENVFQKLVVRKLGGYCMENNTLYATVLRSLGIQLYVTGGRISNAVEKNGGDLDGFAGLEHMIIIATINDKLYHIDVGFGNQGPLCPLPLQDGATMDCVPGLKVRLSHRPIAEYTTDQKLWILQTKYAENDVWQNGYCFGLVEFLPQDFKILNYHTMADPSSWFTYMLVVTRVTLKAGEEEAEGTVTISGDTVRRRTKGEGSEVVEACKSEGQRVEALERWFGIVLLEEEIDAIRGFTTEIKP